MTTLFERPATPAAQLDLGDAADNLVAAYTGALADIAALIRSQTRLSDDLHTAQLGRVAAERREAALAAEYGAAVLERDAARDQADRMREQLADLLPASPVGVDLEEIRTILARAHRPLQEEESAQDDRAALAWAVTALLPLAEALLEPRPGTEAALRTWARAERALFAQQQDYRITGDDRDHWEVTR
ncbi:hypothetical protein [Kitasatospora sp. NPDC047058]|uniref:hypothetical protein n=1 Tax=Kitasatospora sp. NPDC047058 TaxID=3155620 RepID=UPI0033EE985F